LIKWPIGLTNSFWSPIGVLPTGISRQLGSALECVASATQQAPMKSATFPSLRVDPDLREAAESVLQEGETLSSFIEASVRETIERRRARAEFIARGLAARDDAKRTGEYHSAKSVHTELRQMFAKASKRVRG
jgi:predicted transcriptional regulator